jgi:hypothetical protein
MASKTTPDAPAPDLVEDASGAALSGPADDRPAPDAVNGGGVFVNVGGTGLVLIDPPGGVVHPGRVVTLPYTATHRDLRPATPAEIKASAAADAADAQADQAAALLDTTSGTE